MTNDCRWVSIPFLVLVFLLSLSWLFPHHLAPWTTFFQESYLSLLLFVVACLVLASSTEEIRVSPLVLAVLLVSLIPWLQLALDTVYAFGTAWMHWLFLTGLAFSIALGAHWERVSPGRCLDFLFSAIVIAALVSVGIQLFQWFPSQEENQWVLASGSNRFYANIGQPNLLATLLLMACLGVAWGYSKRLVGGGGTIFTVVFLLVGITLTESRTAWVNVFVISVILLVFWRKERPQALGVAISFLLFFFISFSYFLSEVNAFFDRPPPLVREAFDPTRLAMWKGFFQVFLERPLLGFGWGQLTEAVYLVSDFPETGGNTRHAHNLIIEILCLNGLVFGGGIILGMGWVFCRLLCMLTYGNPGFLIPFSAVSILIVHAMLELPLHYAYFLFPFGLVLGVLSSNLSFSWCFSLRRFQAAILLALVFVAALLTMKDYQEVERTYHSVYYGLKGEGVPDSEVPDILILTQWRDRFFFANTPPKADFSPESYEAAKKIIVATPSHFLLYILAHNLAVSGQVEEAKFWLNKICDITTLPLSAPLQEKWLELSKDNSAYQKVEWQPCAR